MIEKLFQTYLPGAEIGCPLRRFGARQRVSPAIDRVCAPGDRQFRILGAVQFCGQPLFRMSHLFRLSPVFGMMVAAVLTCAPVIADEPVRFSWDVLPILSENCLACHGPDESNRKADLRLDTRESALAVIAPGQPQDSELLQRITSSDPDIVMPPPASHRNPLTARQMEVLQRWIAEGANWGKHWAFELPAKAELPESGVHPVDSFVQTELRKHDLSLSPEAPIQTLARRVSMDLTGLSPAYEKVVKWQQAISTGADHEMAYESFVDELLKSPHYGERMAMWWLDAARYADTDGFQGDATRSNWPWRDWVVEAFNSNLPFDQFTIEQFAGDLLENATPEQQLATAFHRHHMTNGEGGRDPEESRIDYVIDRVNSVGTVWLGLTLGCCQCHTHKYDPISHHEYYSLNAFFNSIDEDGRAGKAAKPYLKYQSPYVERALQEAQALLNQRRRREQAVLAEAQRPFHDWVEHQTQRVRQSADIHGGAFQAWKTLHHARLESSEGTLLTQEPDGTVVASGPNPFQDDYRVIARLPLPRVTGIRLQVQPHAAHTKGSYSRGPEGHFVLTDVKVQVRQQGSSQVRDIIVSNAIADVVDDPKKYAGYGDIRHILDDDPRNGWSTRDHDPQQTRTAVLALAEPLSLESDEELVIELRHRSTLGNASIGRFRVSITDEAGPAVQTVTETPLEQLASSGINQQQDLPDDLRKQLLNTFLADYQPYQIAKAELDRAQEQLREVKESMQVDVMVLQERSEPRVTNVLLRGVWDSKGDAVLPDVPAAIADWPEHQPRTRLGLAKWVVSKQNPLTARVVVNHIWQLFFGNGLVRTPDDFGLQGERPTHPELLDWLAVDLMEHQWDLRRLIRLIVTSRTYRQQSEISAQLLERDPENRLLARGARFRFPSWMLRDAALKASGLINSAIGGPPVRPYQPDGVWEEMFMGRFRYVPSDGDAQYRRTLYAFWRRAVAPTFLFDSAQRRVCEVRPGRTNTPLQALVLLNDAGYLEAARALAEQTAADNTRLSLNLLANRVLLRNLSDNEQSVLSREYLSAVNWYRQHPQDAVTLLTSTDRNGRFGTHPERSSAANMDALVELAGRIVAAGIILNLDEAVTHE